VPAKRAETDVHPELRALLTDSGLWTAAADVLRTRLTKSPLSPEDIEGYLGVTLATSPACRAIRASRRKAHSLSASQSTGSLPLAVRIARSLADETSVGNM